MFGRQPRALLNVLKEAWETEPVSGQNVTEYVTGIRDKLEIMSQLVKENLQKEQETQETWAREFKVGNRVLVLVPTDSHKFLAKW